VAAKRNRFAAQRRVELNQIITPVAVRQGNRLLKARQCVATVIVDCVHGNGHWISSNAQQASIFQRFKS
jgi:hypothetical protein